MKQHRNNGTFKDVGCMKNVLFWKGMHWTEKLTIAIK